MDYNSNKLKEFVINACVLNLKENDILYEYGKKNLIFLQNFSLTNNINYKFFNQKIYSRINFLIAYKSKIIVRNKSIESKFYVYKIQKNKFLDIFKKILIFIFLYVKHLLEDSSLPTLVGSNSDKQEIIIKQKIFDNSLNEYCISKNHFIKLIIKQVINYIKAILYSEVIFIKYKNFK